MKKYSIALLALCQIAQADQSMTAIPDIEVRDTDFELSDIDDLFTPAFEDDFEDANMVTPFALPHYESSASKFKKQHVDYNDGDYLEFVAYGANKMLAQKITLKKKAWEKPIQIMASMDMNRTEKMIRVSYKDPRYVTPNISYRIPLDKPSAGFKRLRFN